MRITKLKTARESKLLTQEELGKLAGITRETVNRIENGRSANLNVIKRLAKALEVVPQELF